MSVFLGIDPGNSSGSVAAVSENGEHVSVLKLPQATLHDIAAFVQGFAPHCGLAVLERVSAMPKQGVSSSFKFGVSFGELRMALAAFGVPFEEIGAAKWQAAMGCRSKGDKNVTKAAAQKLWPALRMTHGMADGLLLAEYARRLYAQRVTLASAERPPESSGGSPTLQQVGDALLGGAVIESVEVSRS